MSSVGSHANDVYAMLPDTANEIVSAQTSGSRHSLPNTRGLAVSMSTSPAPARSRTSSITHGMIASTAKTAHMPSESRQPAVSAMGTATSGGPNDATAIVVE